MTPAKGAKKTLKLKNHLATTTTGKNNFALGPETDSSMEG